MAILATGNTFATGNQVTAATLNASVNSATFASGAVDGTTTQLSSGSIIVKDAGISTAKLADDAVTDAKVGTLSDIDIDGGAIDGTPIGANSASTGSFSTLAASGEFTSAKLGYITTSDFTKSANTTLSNITGLSHTVTAGGTYIVSAVLHLSCTGSGGYKFAVSGTATATSIGGSGCTLPGANALVLDADTFTALDETFSTIQTTGATVAKHICDFAIVVNAGGTLTIQFAQNNADTTSTVLARSFMTVTRIA